jgi:methionyl-tRNA formyltransferase
MERPRIVFMGTPDFAVIILRYLVANACDVVAVYTRRDQAAGRGRTLTLSPVKRAAMELGIPVVQPQQSKDVQAVADLTSQKPDLVVVAAYGQILSQAMLEVPHGGCLNVHPSLLPRFRGVSPVPATILSGDEFAGVSVMLLDAGTDTGPVLARAAVPVAPGDSTGSLTYKLARVGAPLLLHVMSAWGRGGIEARPQDEREASYCRKMSKADGEIDWSLPAVDIWRRVRAFDPWPGAVTTWRGRQLRIVEAVPLPAAAGPAPGQVIDLGDGGIGVGTGVGVLGLRTVQLEGKRAMSGADFARGQRQVVGAVLPG